MQVSGFIFSQTDENCFSLPVAITPPPYFFTDFRTKPIAREKALWSVFERTLIERAGRERWKCGYAVTGSRILAEITREQPGSSMVMP